MPSRTQFLDNYHVSLEAEHDFQIGGVTAKWASGHPKEWSEHNSFPIPTNGKLSEEDKSQPSAFKHLDSDVSADYKLLAISIDERILIYDVTTRQLRQELEGNGSVAFSPAVARSENTLEEGQEMDVVVGRPAYVLISGVSNGTNTTSRAKTSLIIWELDKNGRVIDQEEHIDAAQLASKAIESIVPELEATHEWTRSFIESSSLAADFERALSKVSAKYNTRHNTIFSDATLAKFGATPFSANGKKLLYLSKDATTQHKMRKPDELPQVVIWDVEFGKEDFRLQGHTDAIMWAGFSPSDRHIASVSWDGTMRMYDGLTGAFVWATENSGGQSWAGAFTPDSKHIAWTSKGGNILQIHDVADGRLIAKYPGQFKHWCRFLTWHPDGQQLALTHAENVNVWRPFEKPENGGKITQHFALQADTEWRGFVNIKSVSWMDNGNKLGVSISDGSSIVWDMRANCKELFSRPAGVQVAFNSSGLHFIPDEDLDFYVSVDGDDRVRYWNSSVPAHPSWWEKEEKVAEVPKKEFPETGKYVKITKPKPKPIVEAEKGEDRQRDAWAHKGAELWSAE